MLKKLFFAAVTLMIVSAAAAQNKTSNSLNYKTAIGVKVWNGGGLNLKTFISDKSALEFIGFFYFNGTRITGLYEFHGDLNTEGNLKWYAGFGAHASLYRSGRGGGVDGVIGLDFKFPELPLNLAIDWQPSIELGVGSYNGFAGGYGGLAIRYTL